MEAKLHEFLTPKLEMSNLYTSFPTILTVGSWRFIYTNARYRLLRKDGFDSIILGLLFLISQKTLQLAEKYTGYKICVSLSSTTFFRNNCRAGKYSVE
jgi:hypothetical protein